MVMGAQRPAPKSERKPDFRIKKYSDHGKKKKNVIIGPKTE
jgi:hypothetical protein